MDAAPLPTLSGAPARVVTGAVKLFTADVLADCPFSIAHDYAEAFLHQAQAASGDFSIRVPVRFMPSFVQHRVTMTFALHYDVVDRGRRHDEIDVRWEAGTPISPDFSGTVRFRIAGADTLVRFEGSYRVHSASWANSSISWPARVSPTRARYICRAT